MEIVHKPDRKWKILFLLVFCFLCHTGNAQDAKLNLRNFEQRSKKVSFKVYGACGECKLRIENALKREGIRSAKWNMHNKMLTVIYVRNEFITGEYKIQQLVAEAGHDTHKIQASDSTYETLPTCCRYERPDRN